jgi:hypothetical protein
VSSWSDGNLKFLSLLNVLSPVSTKEQWGKRKERGGCLDQANQPVGQAVTVYGVASEVFGGIALPEVSFGESGFATEVPHYQIMFSLLTLIDMTNDQDFQMKTVVLLAKPIKMMDHHTTGNPAIRQHKCGVLVGVTFLPGVLEPTMFSPDAPMT